MSQIAGILDQELQEFQDQKYGNQRQLADCFKQSVLASWQEIERSLRPPENQSYLR